MKEAYISRILHSDANWTCDSAGRILFALGVQPILMAETDLWTLAEQDYFHGEEEDGTFEQTFTLVVNETAAGGFVQTAQAV